MRTSRIRLLAHLSAPLLGLAFTGAPVVNALPLPGGVPEAGSGEVARIRRLVRPADAASARLRAAAEAGSLRRLVGEAVEMSGEGRPAASPPVPPDATIVDALSGLPPSLAAPIADLSASVSRAAATVRSATAGLSRHATRRALGALAAPWVPAAPTMRPGPGGPASRAGAARSYEGAWRDLQQSKRAAVAPALSSIDRQAIEAAALSLAATLDRSLGPLRAAAPLAPEAPAEGEAGCDLVDLPPVLCVGGRGSNIYTADVALLVDLGGGDVYENSSGGANVFEVGTVPVSVNVDLGGNDTYERTAEFPGPMSSSDVVQGAALGGVGILVDAGGNDSYGQRATIAPDAPETLSLGVDSQGFGALGGVGLLADLGGNDTYTVDLTSVRPQDLVQAVGQGIGLVGVGILLDAGFGDDAYRIEGGTSGPRPPDGSGAVTGAGHSVSGQGLGALGGVGVLLDGGGADSFSLSSAASSPAEYTSYGQFANEFAPTATVFGQGEGTFGGAGLLLVGPGATTYSAEANGSGLTATQVFAQGVASVGSMGVLDDEGGNDGYTLSTEMTASVEATVPIDDAECGCRRVVASIEPIRTLTTQDVGGQGFGIIFGGPAVLKDHAGDDRYMVSYRSAVEARAVSSEPGVGAAATARSFSAGPLTVQGVARSVSAGALLDAAGNDAYEVDLHTGANASAEASGSAPATASARATWLQPGYIAAQGSTVLAEDHGVLADLGGSDRYRSDARTVASASPNPDGAIEEGGLALAQGSGPNAVLLDADSGEPDAFSSEPNFPDTCLGTYRGEPPGWAECPTYEGRPLWYVDPPSGKGAVDSAPVKQETAIAFYADQKSSAPIGSTIAVAGRLTGPGGQPLAGRYVTVRWQYFESPSTFLGPAVFHFWNDGGATHAVTGEDGTWRAVLHVPEFDTAAYPGPYRLLAIHSGDRSLRAANAALPFSIAES